MRRKPQSRVWGRHSPTSFPRGAKPQNCGFWHRGRNLLCNCRRLPLSGFSVHRTDRTGLAARCGRPFSFRQYYSAEGLCCPLNGDFLKISFASVMRERGFWQPASRKFFLSLPTPPLLEICQTEQAVFSGFTYLLRVICDFAKWTTKKAANLFQTYCFRWPPVAAGILF